MLTKLSRQQKIDTIQKGVSDCLKNHLLGYLITLPDMSTIQWYALIGKRSYKLRMGDVIIDYDFDFSFDANLEGLYDVYIEKHINDFDYEE